MAHRVNVNDEDYRSMDGWPVPCSGGPYPDAVGVEPGKIYTDEEEKELHRIQEEARKDRKKAVKDYLNWLK